MAENILIVYYSHSGNTKNVAETIRRITGGTLYEIQPEVLYPVDYNTVTKQAKKEINAGSRPPIKPPIGNIGAYDTLFIGSPNWWSTITPPITTFLVDNGLSGKTIIPFCTHGGGGLGNIERDISKLCPRSKVLPGLSVYGSGGGNTQISAWLQKIGEKYDLS